MIPCCSERERHAADLQRLARRADATLGPSRFPSTTRIDGHGEKYLSRGVSFRCRGFSLTPWFVQRVCLNHQIAIWPIAPGAIGQELA